MSDYQIKDSGTHQEYDTGARRDNTEMKGAFHLLPWESIWHLALHYEKGAKKYAERNWEKGIPVARYCEAISRHMTQFQMGMNDENHLVAAYWNIASLYQTVLWIQRGELPEELYNMPNKVCLPEPDVIVKARRDCT